MNRNQEFDFERLTKLIKGDNVEALKEKLEADKSIVDLAYNDQRTLLHDAAMRELPAFVKLLLKHGAEVDPQDEDGKTPLYLAVAHAHRTGVHADAVETVRLLRKAGANPNVHDNAGIDPIELVDTMLEKRSNEALLDIKRILTSSKGGSRRATRRRAKSRSRR